MIYKEIKPDFKKALEKANDILISSDLIYGFPFSIVKVIKEKSGIQCKKYYYASTLGIDMFMFGSEDAILISKDKKYIIFFNDEIENKSRKRFSIGHEFGHYMLDHNLNFKSMYDVYEIEANFFVAQLYMPEQVINELKKRGKMITVSNLMKWFGVSRMAAEKRISTLRKIDFEYRTPQERMVDEGILYKFSEFIDSVAPKTTTFYIDYEEDELQKERNSWLY